MFPLSHVEMPDFIIEFERIGRGTAEMFVQGQQVEEE